MADGSRVVDGAGDPVGRIVDVILDVRTVEPAYMTVDCALPDGVAVVVPLALARLLDGSVQVPYAAADVFGAPHADKAGGLLDRGLEDELHRYYAGLEGAAAVGLRRTGGPGRAAVPEPGAGLLRTSVLDANGHVGKGLDMGEPLGVSVGVGVLPLAAELEVQAGYDGPAAYPVTPVGPWPPVSTSSAGPPWWQRRQWRWPSVPSAVRAMRLELRPLLDVTGLPDDQLEDLVLAAGEAAANAVEHAASPALPYFDVLGEVGEGLARIVIQDHGRWRPPTAGGHRGRGLQMMGVLADATLTVGARGTTVVLRSHPRSSG